MGIKQLVHFALCASFRPNWIVTRKKRPQYQRNQRYFPNKYIKITWCDVATHDIWVSWKRWSFAKRTTNNHSIKLMWYQVYRWRCIYLSKWKTIFWLRLLIFHICICFKLLPVPHTHTYVVGHEGIFSIMKFGAHAFFGLCATDSVRGIDFRPNY